MKDTVRESAIDNAKFIYVLMMIVYHCVFNAAKITGGDFLELNKYLILVSGSFPFLAGYMVSHHYFELAREGRDRISVALLVRGVRLLVIYVLMNVLFLGYLVDVFPGGIVTVGGDVMANIVAVDPQKVIYDILVPLGEIMIIGALVLLVKDYLRGLSVVWLLVGVFTLTFYYIDLPYLACGVAGVIAGVKGVDTLLREKFSSNISVILALAFGVALAVYASSPRSTGLFYIAGVIFLFYAIVSLSGKAGKFGAWFENERKLYAAYSLVIYLVHVPLLVVVTVVLGSNSSIKSPYGIMLILLSTVLLSMSFLTRMLQLARSKSVGLNKVYKTIIG